MPGWSDTRASWDWFRLRVGSIVGCGIAAPVRIRFVARIERISFKKKPHSPDEVSDEIIQLPKSPGRSAHFLRKAPGRFQVQCLVQSLSVGGRSQIAKTEEPEDALYWHNIFEFEAIRYKSRWLD